MSNLIEKIKDMVIPDSADENSDRFTPEQQKAIVKLIIQDIKTDELVQREFIEKKKRVLMYKNSEKPSLIEGIKKRAWQSDRNLGVGAAIADAYQSTIYATVWNPDSIHMVATEENDVDNKDNLEKFAKVMVGNNHANVTPEVDDFVQNKIDFGFSAFEIYRTVDYDWVDRRIPTGKGGFKIKTEKIRIEKNVIENIDDLDDLLLPRWGDKIQDLPHVIRIIHLKGDDILAKGEQGQFLNVDAKMVMKFKIQADTNKNNLEQVKAENLGLSDVVDEEFRAQPIDIYKWYGWYTHNGRREKFRFFIERKTETFLSGKPVRKITKTGKIPLVGGPFERITGQLRGKGIYELIEDPINALNEVYNQKADFQYVTNCPFGFHKAGEGYTQNVYDLEPGVSYPSEGNPNEEHFFPNIQRSMAWAEQDIRILFEVIEKRTGAATYFQTNERNTSGTATRDMIVSRSSETRFGKWIIRIQSEICEALTMWLNLYQEHISDNLAERILGEDGRKLFRNLSVETVRYSADVNMEPDIVAGSKAYEKQLWMWAFTTLQASVWFNPQINPKGNWLLTARTMKAQGFPQPEMYLPPEPKPEMGTGKDVDNIWSRIMQGETVEIEPTWNLPEILTGLYKRKEERYFELDEEYRMNFDRLLFEVEIAYQQFVKKAIEDQMANQLAQRAIMQGGMSNSPRNVQLGGAGTPL